MTLKPLHTFMSKMLTMLLFILVGFRYAETSEPAELREYVQMALQNNPQLKAARHQASAAFSKVGQVTSWEAPQVGVEFFQAPIQSFPNPLKDQMEMDYFIQQMIPFPGKLSAMGSAAENNANMMEQSYRALEKKIIRELKSAYYELYLVQRKIAINAENQDLMRSFVDIARQQYEVGMGQQADILRAQTEFSSLINEGINLQQEVRQVEAMINTILNRTTDTPFGSIPDIEAAVPQWTFAQISSLAAENRPELKAMNYNIDMYRAELSASKREYYPDLMGRLMYKDMAMTNDDFWSAMLGVNIPLTFWSRGKYTRKVEENQLNVSKAQEDYSSMKNMVFFEVQDALVKVQTKQNSLDLLKTTVIPQAEQTLKSTIAAYQTGKTEFLMLIDAYRMLLMSELDYYIAVMNFMASQAQLEQAVGLSIDEVAARIR